MFDENATQMTALALSGYSLGMIAYSIRDILGKNFYSLKDTKTPMINGVIAVILNIAMNIYFSKIFGYAGLALATSVSSIICVITLLISLHRKMGYFGQDKILWTLLKSLVSVAVMGVVVSFAYNNLSIVINSTILILVISISIGGVIYLGLMYMLKVDELNIILDMVIKIKNNLKLKISNKKVEQI